MNVTHTIIEGKKGQFKLRNNSTGAVSKEWHSLEAVQLMYAKAILAANDAPAQAPASETADYQKSYPTVQKAARNGKHIVAHTSGTKTYEVRLGGVIKQRGLTKDEAYGLKRQWDAAL